MASLRTFLACAVVLILSCGRLNAGLGADLIIAPEILRMADWGQPQWPRDYGVSVCTPHGWAAKTGLYYVHFLPADSLKECPGGHWCELSVTVIGDWSKGPPLDRSENPMHSYAVTGALRNSGDFRDIAKVGYAVNQRKKVPMWRIRSNAYDLFLVIIRRDHFSIEISLTGEDAEEIAKYLGDLKEVVASIRIVKKDR